MVRKRYIRTGKRNIFKPMFKDTMDMAGGIIGLGMVVEVSKNLRQNL